GPGTVCNEDTDRCEPHPLCPPERIGDGVCDEDCEDIDSDCRDVPNFCFTVLCGAGSFCNEAFDRCDIVDFCETAQCDPGLACNEMLDRCEDLP
ncbi:MAG: hypothetical protein KC492_34560, partial [Myxococcales bacterium]|nr:hypothetical protein [Myxococcales bacterium]